MSFPHNDRLWVEVAAFVARHRRADETVLAPDVFWWRLRVIERYRGTYLDPGRGVDWAIVHKGLLEQISEVSLDRIEADLVPVFANAVFVVWARPGRLAQQATGPDVEAYAGRRRLRGEDEIPDTEQDHVLPDPGRLQAFDTLDMPQLAQAMDRFWAAGGYRYDLPRDRAYIEDLRAVVASLVGDPAGLGVLDIACGDGALLATLAGAEAYVGVEISPVAASLARRHPGLPDNSRVVVSPAETLDLGEARFDLTLFVEASEHVLDVEAALAACARHTRPGGRMIVTGANRNSLNQMMMRALGYPEFATNYQHLREFTYDELEGMLDRHGFDVSRSEGVMLYPYWGIPGVDAIVHQVCDSDPEIVEVMRVLGRQAGPRHAYVMVLEAVRR
ncbi:MAG: class I SAM-dependent methyltransferase [Azospirillaceae bacterium]